MNNPMNTYNTNQHPHSNFICSTCGETVNLHWAARTADNRVICNTCYREEEEAKNENMLARLKRVIRMSPNQNIQE